MEAIASLIAAILTVPVFIPFIAFFIVYFLLLWRQKSKKDAIASAMNVTTFFLITAVMMMYGFIKSDSTFPLMWWIIAFFLLTGSAITLLQYKVRGRIDPLKIVRAVWRLAFLFFSITYFVLFVSSIAHFIQLT